MKIVPRCYLCQIKRISTEIDLLPISREKKIEALQSLYDFYDSTQIKNSAELGTDARAHITKITGIADPYVEIKRKENAYALSKVPEFRTKIQEILNQNYSPPKIKDSEYQIEYLRLAFLSSIIGNMMEYFLLEHSFEGGEVVHYFDTESFYIDDTKETYHLLKEKISNILYFTDNAGEIALDVLTIEMIKQIFPSIKITVAVKAGPIINDAGMEDALIVGMDKVADRLITIGTNSVGLLWDRTSQELKEIWNSADMIIMKGMGNYETMVEDYSYLKVPLLHLFRVKCSSVAESIGAPRNQNVVKLVHPK